MQLPQNVAEFECQFGFGAGLLYESLYHYVKETKKDMPGTWGM